MPLMTIDSIIGSLMVIVAVNTLAAKGTSAWRRVVSCLALTMAILAFAAVVVLSK
jgi:hypothetical protein